MIHFKCTCGNALFFENTLCLQCGKAVGYDLADNTMKEVGEAYRQCRNGTEYSVCNWVVPTNGPEYCTACAVNHMVPDLSVPDNQDAWRKMEAAKRRAIYTLARLGLVPRNRKNQPDGVAFDFLIPTPTQAVMTGHDQGVITLNLLEADDLYREHERHRLGEPYRTLVGHFRHELGHYYWDRFFLPRNPEDALMVEYRTLFGDEREDYTAALAKYYANGPVANWPSTYITSYAAAHPWEDWAETWAQYLHIVDGMETASAFGWTSKNVPIPFTPFKPEEVLADTPNADAHFLSTLNGWAKLSPALNEMASSLGHTTLYPFIFSPQTVRKILFVHTMVTTEAKTWNKQPAVQPPPLPAQPPPLPRSQVKAPLPTASAA